MSALRRHRQGTYRLACSWVFGECSGAPSRHWQHEDENCGSVVSEFRALLGIRR